MKRDTAAAHSVVSSLEPTDYLQPWPETTTTSLSGSTADHFVKRDGVTFAWATDNLTLRHADISALKGRYAASGIKTRYYTPEIHRAAFALPRYILEAIGK